MATTIAYDGCRGCFYLIPYGMREGQHPFDILPKLRNAWIEAPIGDVRIPRDVAWYHRSFVSVETGEV